MSRRERVVVTGVGIFCSLGSNKRQVWLNMLGKKSGIKKVSRFSCALLSSQLGAEIEGHYASPELEKYNLCVQYAAIAAQQALEDSGFVLDRTNADKIGISLGTCNGGLDSFEKPKKMVNIDKEASTTFPLFQQADYLAEYLKIAGPVMTNSTACAASGNALGFAYELVAGGYVEAVLAGGSDSLAESVFAGFNILRALSPQPCAPFGSPYGLNLGEGSAFVLVEPLGRALQRGAFIYAELCGYGLSQDAYHATTPHPEGDGIAQAVSFALKNSGITPEQIEYVNVHGTGTEANDSAELKGLRKSLGSQHFSQVSMSSSKPYFGHTLGAAAIIEYVATLIALQNERLPATLHVAELRAGCRGVNLIKEETVKATTRFFLCSNAGFGGHNSAVVSLNWLPSKENKDFANGEGKLYRLGDPARRVGVMGLGMANQYGCLRGSIQKLLTVKQPLSEESARKQVKQYIKTFYSRRMNILTQYTLASVHLALADAGLTVTEENATEIALIYGTAYGSLQSFTKYLAAVFEKGPLFASALYFPDTVHNSTPGKVATKLGIKGYGSTMSTGGNEGLMTLFWGYEAIRNNYQPYCLVGAGEESSRLMQELNSVLGLDKSRFPLTEGSCFMVLADLEEAKEEKQRFYAELKGFGFSFSGTRIDDHGERYKKAIEMALQRAQTTAGEVDFVYYNDAGFNEQSKVEQQTLAAVFANKAIPVQSVNHLFGYTFSASSLYHLYMAVDLLLLRDDWEQGVVVSSSYNRSNVAVVIGKVKDNYTFRRGEV